MNSKTFHIISYIILLILFLYIGKLFIFSKSSNISESMPSTVVELHNGEIYNLTASYITHVLDGKSYQMLGYNGSIPGPTIKVQQGSEITINFKNNTDIPQLLHSHGVRMENKFDGSQSVQKEIKPGESFSYKLTFPDAGIYWYHPHAGEVYGQGLGLYGAFIVEPKDSGYLSKVNSDTPLFLSDIQIENHQITLTKDDTSHSLMGHYGNTLLINGQTNFELNTHKGDVVRLYIVNSANARPFNFAVKGLKMKLVGGDSGVYEKESFVESVILGPSERAIVDVYITDTGSYDIVNITPENTYNLGKITADDVSPKVSYREDFDILHSNKFAIKSIDPFRQYFSKKVDKNITLTLSMMGGMGGMMNSTMSRIGSDGIEWNDNGQMSNMPALWKIIDTNTGKENIDIDWVFKKDQPVKIKIFNDPQSMHPMQHPIHFHGQRFLVISRNGIQQTNLVWKDTALVRAGETIEILLDPSNQGLWMAHCHISEHLGVGMMFQFLVK